MNLFKRLFFSQSDDPDPERAVLEKRLKAVEENARRVGSALWMLHNQANRAADNFEKTESTDGAVPQQALTGDTSAVHHSVENARKSILYFNDERKRLATSKG